jgi:hypothetical protein
MCRFFLAQAGAPEPPNNAQGSPKRRRNAAGRSSQATQRDGTYKDITVPVTCFCHFAAAVDYAGGGYADIFVTDHMVAATPFFLANNRDGSFTVDTSRLPASLQYKAIFSAELIDFEGHGSYDFWLGGNEPGATAYETTTAYDLPPAFYSTFIQLQRAYRTGVLQSSTAISMG